MTALKVKLKHIEKDELGYWLKEKKARQFAKGNYTHIRLKLWAIRAYYLGRYGIVSGNKLINMPIVLIGRLLKK